MQKQLGRLEAGAVTADVEHADLDGLERLGNGGNRAGIAFDHPQLVIGLCCDAAFEFRHEDIAHALRIDRRAGRVAGADPQRDELRPRRGSEQAHAHEKQADDGGNTMTSC